MSFEPIIHEDKKVYPSAAVVSVEENNAIFDDELYNSLKNPEANTEQAPEGQQTVETTNEEVQQQNEENPSNEGTPSQENTIDFDALIKEKTGGRFEKWEDINQLISNPLPKIEDENSRLIYDYIASGKTEELTEYLNTQRLLSGIDSLEDADVVKLRMQFENPDWSSLDVEDEFERLYSYEPDDTLSPEKNERNKRAVERTLKSAVRDARTFLSAKKAEIKLEPLYQPQENTSEIDVFESVNKDYQDSFEIFNKDIQEFKNITIKGDDKDDQFSFSFEVLDEEKAKLTEQLKDYWSYFQSTYYKDGKWDVVKLMRNEYIINNFNKIIKAVRSQAINEKAASVVNNLSNASGEGNYSPSVNAGEKEEELAMRNFLLM